MLTVSAPQQTVLEARYTGLAVFVSLAFTSGTLRFTTQNINVSWGGFTWNAAGRLASIGDVKETEKFESNPIDISLNVADATILSLALTDPYVYRGKPAIIYMGPMTDGVLIGTPIMCWNGFMDTMVISYNNDGTGAITARCKPTSDRLSRPSGLRANAEQQALVLSTDRGFEYLNDLITKPQLWLSKRFQEV